MSDDKAMDARKNIMAHAERLGEEAEDLFDKARDREASAIKLSVLCLLVSNDGAIDISKQLDACMDDPDSVIDELENDADDALHGQGYLVTSKGGLS